MRLLTRIACLKCLHRQIFLIFLPVLSSCGETLVGSDPANRPQKNFQILWDEFDRYYALFEVKNVNWNALYNIYSPQVTDQTDDQALFNIMSSMLIHLDDDHVHLIAPFGKFISSNASGQREGTLNLDFVKRKYLRFEFQTTGNGDFFSGQICDAVCYLHIASFSSRNGSAWVETIDHLIVNEFFNYSGLIIDIRGNPGGDGLFAEAVAARFIDQKQVYVLYQTRNGPHHSDFGPIRERYLEPAGIKQFTKPIIVLTDRMTGSAAEIFLLAMKRFSHVRVVGDVTAGGMAPSIYRELPNGWIYRISIGRIFSADNVLYEGVGIPPDVHVAVSSSDTDMEKDPVIEMAIQLLQ